MTKIRLFYEPPPYGIATDLNRSGYGIGGGGLLNKVIQRASRMPQSIALGVPTLLIVVISYIPVSTYTSFIAILNYYYLLLLTTRQSLTHHQSRFTQLTIR